MCKRQGMAQVAYDLGDRGTALRLSDTILQLSPDQPQVLSMRGWIALDQGEVART